MGRKEIIDWINSTLSLNLVKIEETASGAVACQLLDIMYPGQVPMHKINWSAKQDFEFVSNYKVLQTCFTKLGVERHVDVDRLISGRYMDNLEFMQWFKAFFERSVSDIGEYDAYSQRCKGKGGAQFHAGKSKGTKADTKVNKTTIAPKTKTTTTRITKSTSGEQRTKENAVPNKPTPATSVAKTASSYSNDVDISKYLVEIQSLNKSKEESDHAMEEAKTELEGLEKERDFYFEKLRDIEILLQDIEDKGEGNELTAQMFKILYATCDGFEVVDEAAEVATAPAPIATEAN